MRKGMGCLAFACLAYLAVKPSMSGRWGFIDKTGKMVINPQFDEVESFSGGRARVKNETRIGYIDVTGNYVSNPSN